MDSSVTYAAVLPIDRAVVGWFSRKLACHRRNLKTKANTRQLTAWAQAVLVLRWLLDGTRIRQLQGDNNLGCTTTYAYLWEELKVLAVQAPTMADAIDAARAAGDSYIGLDGTLILMAKTHLRGPTDGVDLWLSGKHHRHGANIQVMSAPDGYPLWVFETRPGREHDSTAVIKHGKEEDLALLSVGIEDRLRLLALVDLGYEKFKDFLSVHMPHKKKPKKELNLAQKQYNKAIGAARALAEKANADLNVRSKALALVSLNPWRIGTIVKACLAVFRIDRPRGSRLTPSHG
ncbi:transposase family protein [Salininema proteolyticum]|uniref:Transposase family protein n=1 Tax=Salininema proteolyticum TaxID=1607685 RepID=A0ABV8TY13_9ACTN